MKKPEPETLPAHAAAWAELEPKRRPLWRPGPASKVRFAKTPAPMPADAFRKALHDIGINQSAFSRWIGVDGRTVRLWLSGKWPVPLAVGYLVSLMIRTSTRPEDLT